MPASYAHYRFGKLLLPKLPADVRQTVQRFRRMYDLGLQGPDFFFYYNIFMKTATGSLGSAFHRQTGLEFFTVACKAATSDAAKAYLYGLLGHYCLDSTCHPFVNRLAAIGEAKHVPLESEFERYLLLKDKEPSPHTYDAGKFLKLTRGEALTVATFYPGVTGWAVSHSVRSMALFLRLLAHPNRKLQKQILSATYPKLLDFRIPEESSDALAPYVSELSDLYDQALERYPSLLQEITAHLQTGEPLTEAFAPDFG